MAEFTAEIAQALQEECDEVLVVGHSSGAHLGVSILADLIRGGQVPGTGPALSFLSLGQVVPMVSFLPRAWRLRGQTRIEMQAWILAIKAQASAANDRTAPPRADEDQKATPGDAPSPAPARTSPSPSTGGRATSR